MRLTKRLALTVMGVILTASVAVTGCKKVQETVEEVVQRDPKEVVLEAFEGVFPKDKVSPMDDIFAFTEMNQTLSKADSEFGLTVKLDSCSDPSINTFAGSGLRIEGVSDVTNKKNSADIAVIYNGMDLATLQTYLADETLMLKLPELNDRVFTLDISEGLLDRVSESAFIGPILAQSGVDMEAMADYMDEIVAQAESADGSAAFDLKSIYNRYKEGSEAQKNFKAALTVEAGKDTETIEVDGKDEECKSYEVAISKESMIEFLNTSKDFFLQDEELKELFLQQLETSVKLSGILDSSGTTMPSASEMLQSSYEDLEAQVDEAISYLDKCLTDVELTVYVTEGGRLAAMEGTTVINTEDMDDVESIDVEFYVELQGGNYPTENVDGNVVLTNSDVSTDQVTVNFTKTGTYDDEEWSSDFVISMTDETEGKTYSLGYDGKYAIDSGEFSFNADVSEDSNPIIALAMNGVVEELEKGKSISAVMDELSLTINDDYSGETKIGFSGDFSYRPMTGEVVELEGDRLDILAASQEDWMVVIQESQQNIMRLLQQLGLY